MLMFDEWHPIILFQMSVLQEARWRPRSAVERPNISDMSEWHFKMKTIRSFSSFLQSKDGRCPALRVSETWRARFSAGSSCWGHSCHRLNNARGSGLHVQNETEGKASIGWTVARFHLNSSGVIQSEASSNVRWSKVLLNSSAFMMALVLRLCEKVAKK